MILGVYDYHENHSSQYGTQVLNVTLNKFFNVKIPFHVTPSIVAAQ
jgi:hypothetical protein